MESIFLELGVILIATKVIGLIFSRYHVPQIVGALIAGLLIGPTFLNLFPTSEFIEVCAEIGVVLIMFNAGLEIDAKAMIKNLSNSLIIAIFGVIFSIILGGIIATIYGQNAVVSLYIGLIFASTSVSVGVQTLKESNLLKIKSSQLLLSTAVVDDILGVILFALMLPICSSGDFSILSLTSTILNIIVFFVVAATFGLILNIIFKKSSLINMRRHRTSIIALGFCFILAYLAEFFGLSNLVGAFIAGFILSSFNTNEYIEHKTDTLSYLFFSPIFFASIGLETYIPGITVSMLVFLLIMGTLQVIAKMLGCYIGSRLSGFDKKTSIQIGSGMVARCEVALIIAATGVSEGIIRPEYFSSIVLVVIFTSLATPFLIKMSFNKEIKENEIKDDITI